MLLENMEKILKNYMVYVTGNWFPTGLWLQKFVMNYASSNLVIHTILKFTCYEFKR